MPSRIVGSARIGGIRAFSTDRFIYLDTRDYSGCSQHKQPRFERVGGWLYVHAMD
jgi:hypothetical protein